MRSHVGLFVFGFWFFVFGFAFLVEAAIGATTTIKGLRPSPNHPARKLNLKEIFWGSCIDLTVIESASGFGLTLGLAPIWVHQAPNSLAR